MSLRSAGYDAVILINERFLNQLSGALFYNGFLRIAKDIDLIEALEPTAAEKIGPALRPFLKMNIRLHLLHEPSIDFLKPADSLNPFRMRLFLDLRANITLWDGLELPFNVRLSLISGCKIERVPEAVDGIEPNSILNKIESEYLEPGSQMMLMDFARSELETFTISWNEQKMQALSIELDKLVMTVVRAYLEEDKQCYAVALPSFGRYIPGMEKLPANRLECEIAHCSVLSEDTLAVAFNFGDYKGGSPEQLYNFARNCSVGVAVPEASIHKVLDFAWAKLFEGKVIGGQKSFESEDADGFISTVGKVFDVIGRVTAEIASLGFVETEIKFHGLKFIVDYQLEFAFKPSIDLMPGNYVRLYNAKTKGELGLRVLMDTEFKAEIDPTGWLPDFIPDIEICHERRDLEIFNMRLKFDEVGLNEATGKIVFDEPSNTLALSLESIDLALNAAISLFDGCPFLSFPALVQETVCQKAEEIIIEKCPKVSVIPPLRLALPLIPWPIYIRGKKLDIQADELTAALDAWFEPLKQDMPYVPKYIVNTNNNEIHCLGCNSLLDTYEEHQKGFHLLNDALNRGYDGCGRCLPEFHTR